MNRPSKTGGSKTREHLLNRKELGVQLQNDVANQMIPVADMQEQLPLATFDITLKHQRRLSERVLAELAISARGRTGIPVSESAPMRIPQAPFPESCSSAKARSAPANARMAIDRFANPLVRRFSESSRKLSGSGSTAMIWSTSSARALSSRARYRALNPIFAPRSIRPTRPRLRGNAATHGAYACSTKISSNTLKSVVPLRSMMVVGTRFTPLRNRSASRPAPRPEAFIAYRSLSMPARSDCAINRSFRAMLDSLFTLHF